jgi:transcriptional regulator with XRE-family HTH domain
MAIPLPVNEEQHLHPGEVLLLARKRAHREQEEVAAAAGVSKSTISNWERGKGEPTVTAWWKIARFLDARWMLDLGATPSLSVTDRELGELEPTQLALPLFRHLQPVP